MATRTAKKGSASVQLRGGFPPGITVGLYDRVGDTFAAVSAPVKTAKVQSDSTISFTGLEEGAPYYVAAHLEGGEFRSRGVTAKIQPEAKKREEVAGGRGKFNAQLVSQDDREIITGARNSRTRGHQPPAIPFANDAVGKPSEASKGEIAPQPGPRLEDKPRSQVVASDTVTGLAVPVDDDKNIPRVRQDQVPKGVVQASATRLGEATILPDQPLRQEDVNKSHGPQMSSTETGEATLIDPPGIGEEIKPEGPRDQRKTAPSTTKQSGSTAGQKPRPKGHGKKAASKGGKSTRKAAAQAKADQKKK